jgi:hypothetical protein
LAKTDMDIGQQRRHALQRQVDGAFGAEVDAAL